MKNILKSLLISILFISPLCSREIKQLPEVTKIITLDGLSTEMIEELLSSNHPDIVIECKEGAFVPLQFLYNVHIASLKYSPDLTLKVEKSFYLRFINKKAYMSEDLVIWEKPSKFIGITGKTKAKLKVTEDNALLIEATQEKKEIDLLKLN